MTKRDYYEILGMDRKADNGAIKKAYRNLAMKYHPDRNPGDSEAAARMKEINEAYAVLSDRQKRRLYDTYGHAGLEGYTLEDIFGGVDFGSIFREFGLGGFGFGFGDSLFDSIFGGGRSTRVREQVKAADLAYELGVTLEEVASGSERIIEIPRAETCSLCQGTGAKEGGLIQCSVCGGSGQMITERRSGYSLFRQISPCSNCRGEGRIIKETCDECEGRGFLEEKKGVVVNIPKGVSTGCRIMIEGEGEPGGEGVEPGDLYVVLKVKPHPVFERHGDDIYVQKEISLSLAALGGEIDDIPGLEDNLKLEIPEGTQTGTVFKILNKGLPHLQDYGRGDEYIVVKVATPTDLSEEEKELLGKFEKLRKNAQREN